MLEKDVFYPIQTSLSTRTIEHSTTVTFTQNRDVLPPKQDISIPTNRLNAGDDELH
jgi:hypothetical protein